MLGDRDASDDIGLGTSPCDDEGVTRPVVVERVTRPTEVIMGPSW